MTIDSVVSVVITPASRTPSRAGFGNTLLIAPTPFTDVYRSYTDEADALTDGFTTLSSGYKMISRAFAQNPRPTKVLVGRLPTAAAQSITLTMLSATEGDIVSVEAMNSLGVWATLTHTVGAAATTTTVATAFEVLTEAVTGMDSSSSTAVVTIVPTSNTAPIAFRNPRNLAIKDNTADAATGYATVLANVKAETNDFYFVCTDHNSETVSDLVAAWCQSNKKLYCTQTNDTIEATGTGVFGSGQKAAGYEYSAGVFGYDMTEYPAVAMAAIGAVRDPGSFTWHLKELNGVTVASLTSTHQTNLDTAGWNYYVSVANGISGIMGVNGGGAAFDGTFMDITHGTDALTARLQEGLFGAIANAEKIDYDEDGILILKAKALAVLRSFEDSRLLDKGASSVTYTDPKDSSLATDRGNRYYPSLKFASTYRGAVHKVRLVGTIAT